MYSNVENCDIPLDSHKAWRIDNQREHVEYCALYKWQKREEHKHTDEALFRTVVLYVKPLIRQ